MNGKREEGGRVKMMKRTRDDEALDGSGEEDVGGRKLDSENLVFSFLFTVLSCRVGGLSWRLSLLSAFSPAGPLHVEAESQNVGWVSVTLFVWVWTLSGTLCRALQRRRDVVITVALVRPPK